MDALSLLPYFKFWTYIFFLIPSSLCSFLVLYYLLFNKHQRHALHNHMIILLLCICLICQLTIYPWMLFFYTHHGYWQRSWIFCSIWTFIDWGLFIMQAVLFAWTSIERHILIFHDRWLTTRSNRFLIHYLPPICLTLYCFIWYGFTYLFPLCGNSVVNYYTTACMNSCLYDSNIFSLWETIVNQLLMNLIIILFSLALILRILWQHHRVRRRVQWRKHRKMTVQLLSISFLYLIFSFPNSVLILLMLCGFALTVHIEIKKYAEFCSYLVILFFPFVCILPLSNLRKKIIKFFTLTQHRHAARIHPTTQHRQ
ncbi:unnamed protein product [Adineta ricciae]|uniref:G-protein coupled receptors family 1 profile domain-containing protein n=1 Tax=Adineta ricciae TaxID=249248 RepID=A0A815PGU9_ADIRI|nr:unnamed protein product [Adineta ricciae]CAF1449145.1 unnamed protein product [Adineta ricciae]